MVDMDSSPIAQYTHSGGPESQRDEELVTPCERAGRVDVNPQGMDKKHSASDPRQRRMEEDEKQKAQSPQK